MLDDVFQTQAIHNELTSPREVFDIIRKTMPFQPTDPDGIHNEVLKIFQ